jgi:HAMP domain-containing protein
MFLTAPETKGYTLEEMDDVFDSGLPAWRRLKKRSRMEELEQEIAQGNLKITPAHEKAGVSVTRETPEKQV